MTLGDVWLGPAIRAGLIQPIPEAESNRWWVSSCLTSISATATLINASPHHKTFCHLPQSELSSQLSWQRYKNSCAPAGKSSTEVACVGEARRRWQCGPKGPGVGLPSPLGMHPHRLPQKCPAQACLCRPALSIPLRLVSPSLISTTCEGISVNGVCCEARARLPCWSGTGARARSAYAQCHHSMCMCMGTALIFIGSHCFF